MILKDKVFVVTGAGNGVGRELALQLLARGAIVACVDINTDALAGTLSLAELYRDRVYGYEADITDLAAVKALPGEIVRRFGFVDALINNAGIIHPFLRVEETSGITIENVMRVNFFGALNMTKAFLPYLRMRSGAYIVNMSSAGALAPMPGEAIYGASKAAVRLFTEGLRYELRASGIRVMAVFPGGINTDIIRNSGVVTAASIDQLRAKLSFLLLTPQKVAKRILSGMEKGCSRLVLGIDAVAMDVLCRFSPCLAPQLLYRAIDTILSPHVKSEAVPEK